MSDEAYVRNRLASLQALCRANGVPFSFYAGIDELESALTLAGVPAGSGLAFVPFRVSVLGTLVLEVIGESVVTKPGTVKTVGASLGIASTSGPVIVTVSKNGTLVLTLTFAQGATAATLTWAAGTSFTVATNDVLRYETTSAGTGAQALRFALDA